MTSDRVVFLDLAVDRYFCLGAAADAAFQQLIAARSGWDAFALAPLVAAGILIETDDGTIPSACSAPYLHRSPRRIDDSASRPIGTLVALLDLVQMAVHLRTRTLHEIVADIGKRKPGVDGAAEPGARTEQVARAFAAAGRVIAARDRCLWHSLALASRLYRSGIRVDLIFGVKTIPFAAHCWVQHRGYVLLDDVDHVRNYTPILCI